MNSFQLFFLSKSSHGFCSDSGTLFSISSFAIVIQWMIVADELFQRHLVQMMKFYPMIWRSFIMAWGLFWDFVTGLPWTQNETWRVFYLPDQVNISRHKLFLTNATASICYIWLTNATMYSRSISVRFRLFHVPVHWSSVVELDDFNGCQVWPSLRSHWSSIWFPLIDIPILDSTSGFVSVPHLVWFILDNVTALAMYCHRSIVRVDITSFQGYGSIVRVAITSFNGYGSTVRVDITSFQEYDSIVRVDITSFNGYGSIVRVAITSFQGDDSIVRVDITSFQEYDSIERVDITSFQEYNSIVRVDITSFQEYNSTVRVDITSVQRYITAQNLLFVCPGTAGSNWDKTQFECNGLFKLIWNKIECKKKLLRFIGFPF